MTKRVLKKQVTVDEEVEFPDHLSDDESLRGRAVNAYLKARHYRPDRLRDDLYSEELSRVRSAVSELLQAYEVVDAIFQVFKEAGAEEVIDTVFAQAENA